MLNFLKQFVVLYTRFVNSGTIKLSYNSFKNADQCTITYELYLNVHAYLFNFICVFVGIQFN